MTNETGESSTITVTGTPLFTRLAYPQKGTDTPDDGKYICRLQVPPTPANLAAKEAIKAVNTNCIRNEQEDGTFEVKGKLASTGKTKDGTVFTQSPKVYMYGEQLSQEQIPMLSKGGTVTMVMTSFQHPTKKNFGGLNLQAVILHDDVTLYEGSGESQRSTDIDAAIQSVLSGSNN